MKVDTSNVAIIPMSEYDELRLLRDKIYKESICIAAESEYSFHYFSTAQPDVDLLADHIVDRKIISMEKFSEEVTWLQNRKIGNLTERLDEREARIMVLESRNRRLLSIFRKIKKWLFWIRE